MKATRLSNPHWERWSKGPDANPRVVMHRLFELEPPLPWHKHGNPEAPREELRWILVSDSNCPAFFIGESRPESMAFRSTSQGEWVDGEDLASVVGEFNHRAVLEQLGVTEIVDEIEVQQ
jgi:hypothetical protein